MVECRCADSQFSSVVPEWERHNNSLAAAQCLPERAAQCIRRGKHLAAAPWGWELQGSCLLLPLRARARQAVQVLHPDAQDNAMFPVE